MQVMHHTQIYMQRFKLAPSSPALWNNMKCHRLFVARAVPQRPVVAAVQDRQAATDTVDIQQSSTDGNNSAKLTPSQRRNLRRKRKAAFKQDTSQDEAASTDTEPGKQAVLQLKNLRQA